MKQNYKQIAIKKFGNDYKETNKSDEIIFSCIKCNRQKLYVNLTTGLYHCFRCGYSGKLKSDFESVLNSYDSNKEKLDIENIDQCVVPFRYKELNKSQLEALYNRGITKDDIIYYNIKSDINSERISIPNIVFDNFTDSICNWEYRKEKITKYNPKYLYPKELKTSYTLFNIYNIDSECDNITLCEGIFNAITAGKNAVASFGCKLSDIQLEILLNKNPKSITIAYDSDLPGVTGAVSVIKKLMKSDYKGKVYYILLPYKKDINDLGKEYYQKYYNERKVRINLNDSNSKYVPELLFNTIS